MKPCALINFTPFLLACGEGSKDYLYGDQHKDAHGNPAPVVTAAIGCALFTIDAALALDWTLVDGSPCTDDDVRADWIAVGAHPQLAVHGGSAYRPLMRCRLTKASIDNLVAQRIAAFEVQLRPQFPGYDVAPDKAQEGVMRLAWATGAARFKDPDRWPKFAAAFNVQRWDVCADECAIPGLVGEPTANDLEAALFTACANGDGDYEPASA